MKIYRISGKTRRDDHSNIILYHVSPNRLSNISALSKISGISGAYFSPSYKSIINDWMPYVKSKKHKNHQLEKDWHATWDKIHDLDYKKDKTDKDEIELKRLNEKIEKMRESFNSGQFQKDLDGGYRRLFIHKIECPKYVFNKSKELFNRIYESGYNQDNWGFWGWGAQIFIPEEYLSKLRILNVEELNEAGYHDKYKEFSMNRYKQ
jgi:hypothetical protein